MGCFLVHAKWVACHIKLFIFPSLNKCDWYLNCDYYYYYYFDMGFRMMAMKMNGSGFLKNPFSMFDPTLHASRMEGPSNPHVLMLSKFSRFNQHFRTFQNFSPATEMRREWSGVAWLTQTYLFGCSRQFIVSFTFGCVLYFVILLSFCSHS